MAWSPYLYPCLGTCKVGSLRDTPSFTEVLTDFCKTQCKKIRAFTKG